MNRQERRRSKATRMELVEFSVGQLVGGMCSWDGCGQIYEGDLPNGWRYLLLFWAPKTVDRIAEIRHDTWDRDGCLCPNHARELDGLLLRLGRHLSGPAMGRA
jgi:hypothetical protein